MDLDTLPHVASRVWAVTPSQHPLAFGAPVFRIFEGECSRETAVAAVTTKGAVCQRTPEDLTGFLTCPALEAATLAQLPSDVPLSVQDNIEAFITHKRMMPPRNATGTKTRPEPADLTPGVVEIPRLGPSAAVQLADTGNLIGLLAIVRSASAVHLRPVWATRGSFMESAEGFAEACAGLEHDDFLAGLQADAAQLAIAGVERLMTMERRAIPNQVCAAMLIELKGRLVTTSPLMRRVEQLLRRIEHVEGTAAGVNYARYAEALGTLRQLLAVLVRTRRQVSAERFDTAANLPSWASLIEAIVDTTATMVAAMDGGPTPATHMVERAIKSAAAAAADDYAKGMPSEAGRHAASLAALAMTPAPPPLAELSIEGRFTAAVRLVGESGWILARPYEHGILATVLRGW